jgi:hypothetical protein
MQLPSRRKIAVARTAWRGLTTYGSLKHAQGRLSARRSSRERTRLAAAAAGALVLGVAVGAMLAARRAGGCGHDHDHDHGDLPATSADEQASRVSNGTVSAATSA